MDTFTVLTSAGCVFDDRCADALARAEVVLRPLYDSDALGPMPGLPITKHVEGDCRLCATRGRLTFEHTPAQATGNRTKVRGAPLMVTLEGDDPTAFPRKGSFQAQRGVGANVLCDACNSRTGADLVPAYAALANVLTGQLDSAVTVADEHLRVPGELDLDLRGFRLGAVARQAIVMNLSVSGGAAVTRRWPELREIVSGKIGALPPEVRLGVSVAYSPRVRLAPPVAQIDPDGSLFMFSEVAATPFSWKLAFGDGSAPPAIQGAVDVSDWVLIDPALDVDRYPLTLPVGAIVTGIPGDARDPGAVRAEIERQRRRA